jgi:hypothetical protein
MRALMPRNTRTSNNLSDGQAKDDEYGAEENLGGRIWGWFLEAWCTEYISLPHTDEARDQYDDDS